MSDFFPDLYRSSARRSYLRNYIWLHNRYMWRIQKTHISSTYQSLLNLVNLSKDYYGRYFFSASQNISHFSGPCRVNDGSCQGCMIYTNLGQQFFHIGEVFQLFVGQIKCSLIEAEYVHSGSVMILTSSNWVGIWFEVDVWKQVGFFLFEYLDDIC